MTDLKKLEVMAAFIESRYMPEPNSGCWLWVGPVDSYEYGRIYIDRKPHRAHRVSYELAKGQIPAGLVIDHKCRVHCCVNPDHLEAVTTQVNVLRGVSSAAIAAKKTHCLRGHPLSGKNLRIHRRGHRNCKECERGRNRAWIIRNRTAEYLQALRSLLPEVST